MIDEFRIVLAPWYLHIKWLHVMAAGVWSFSTAVGYVMYLKPALRAARAHPEDDVRRARRDEMMERFDRGALGEHYALAVMVATALLMLWVGGADLTSWNFVTAKLAIGVLVILPMEAIDIHLSHLGANKERIRATGDRDRYEQAMARHGLFLRITEPLVVVLIPAMFFIAIVKPF